MYEAIRRESHGQFSNVVGQGSLISIVLLPAALPGLVEVLQHISDKVMDLEKGVRMIGEYFVDPRTVTQILDSIDGN